MHLLISGIVGTIGIGIGLTVYNVIRHSMNVNQLIIQDTNHNAYEIANLHRDTLKTEDMDSLKNSTQSLSSNKSLVHIKPLTLRQKVKKEDILKSESMLARYQC